MDIPVLTYKQHVLISQFQTKEKISSETLNVNDRNTLLRLEAWHLIRKEFTNGRKYWVYPTINKPYWFENSLCYVGSK